MDWSSCIMELETKGLSLVAIADKVGLSTGAISDLKQRRTKAPTGMAAVRLYELHQRCQRGEAA
jgi:hypothetical protein